MPTPLIVRGPSADPPQAASPTVEIRLRVPRTWRDELQDAAGVRAISMSALLRIVLRDFLSGRYSGA